MRTGNEKEETEVAVKTLKSLSGIDLRLFLAAAILFTTFTGQGDALPAAFFPFPNLKAAKALPASNIFCVLSPFSHRTLLYGVGAEM